MVEIAMRPIDYYSRTEDRTLDWDSELSRGTLIHPPREHLNSPL
jgi:hypothetical protein